MLILSVESTCDETAVAVTENGRRVLTDQIFSVWPTGPWRPREWENTIWTRSP